MPQKVIKFAGINRKVNEFQNSGACEELINLRPNGNGGFEVIKRKRTVEHGVEYESLYEHRFGDVDNRIIVSRGIVEWINTPDNKPAVITSEFSGKEVSISYAGKVIVIYCEEDKRQLIFKFENEEYKPYDTSMAKIKTAEIIYDYNYNQPNRNSATADNNSAGDYIDALQKAASGFYNEYPNGLCGASVVGCTYELEDGSEVWSTAFVVADVTKLQGYTIPQIDTSLKSVVVFGARKIHLKLTFDNYSSASVKKINIYASRPVVPYEIEQGTASQHTVKRLETDVVSLDGQLMYYQGSVTANSESVTYTLDYRVEKSGEAVMDVLSGCIERVGESVSYNNRFHFYRSDVQHIIQSPTISHSSGVASSMSYWVAYVKINNEWRLIDNAYYLSETSPNDFIYPMAGVSLLAFVSAEADDNGNITHVPYNKMFYVDLKDSSAYNYSYAFDVTPVIARAEEMDLFHDKMFEEGKLWGQGFDTKVFLKKESNIINVSAQYNPYVFPVEYSYSFGGEILDIATSYLPISSTQAGQYPLTVFTTNGIYALEQGNGDVLYSNIVPIQPLVIDGKSTTTPYGTFFVSSKNLYILSGRESANISYILNGERELRLRDVDSYKKLYCKENSFLYNFSEFLSKEDFEDFLSGVTLTYDQLHNELYINGGAGSEPYSYVFNLDTKLYHKASKRYRETKSGARYALEFTDGETNLVDMHIEDKCVQPIFLQSKPMSLDVFYTHIQRLMLLADTKLSDDQHLCLSVFASDNLHDWKCIISSQKSDVTLRQIRTNKAAKSYKDYVIVISGLVDSNTDLSDLIADYTVVQRRLG